jgi:hypothetical protein
MRAAVGWDSGAMRPQAHLHGPRLHLVRQSGAKLAGVLKSDLGQPIDMSASDASLLFCVRQLGAEVLKAQVTCSKLAGLEGVNGYVNTAPPYDVPGRGGRFQVSVPPEAFEEVGEYEGELVYFESASADPAVVFDLVRMFVRDNLYGRPVGYLSVLMLTEGGELLLTEGGDLLLTE